MFVKRKTASFIILLLTLCFFSQVLHAYEIDARPTCTYNFNNGGDVVFFGGSNVSTYSSCGCLASDVEWNQAGLYTFLDPLPCEGDCGGNQVGCTGECCFRTIGNYACCGVNYLPEKRFLIVSGDLGKDKLYISVSDTWNSESFNIPGKHELIFAPDTIRIHPSCEDMEDGKIDFTYLVTTKEYQHGTSCRTFYDTAGPICSCGEEDCSDCPDCWKGTEKPLFVTKGSLLTQKNPREDFDLFNILFSPDNALEGLSYFKPVYYKLSDYPFTRFYNRGSWNTTTCSCDEDIVTARWPDQYINEGDAALYRVKIPGWKKDVWTYDISTLYDDYTDYGLLPQYMSREGWGSNNRTKQIWLDLDSYGTIYFHHNEPSDDGQQPGFYLLSMVEYCQSGQTAGQGTIQWRLKYEQDGNGNKHLAYIFTGSDPNYPEQSTEYYKLTWSANYSTVQQEYYNTSIDQSNPLRVWNVSFDAEGRAIESMSGCSSGCGGGSYGYQKVEYFDDFENYDDLVKKKYNSNDDVIIKNDYQTLMHGDYWPTYSIQIHAGSYELPDVNDGQFQQEMPDYWESPDPNKVYVCDPNNSQWDAFYDSGETIPDGGQFVRLTGGTIQQDLSKVGILGYTTYFLEADTGAYTDPNISEVTIKLLAYDPNDPNQPAEELIVIDATEETEPNGFGVQLEEGGWVTQGGLWDSSDHPELNGWFMRILIEGNCVDIDQVSLWVSTFLGGETKPLLMSQVAEPNSPTDPNISFVTWDYNSNDHTAVEKRWVDNQTARVVKYYYEDSSFSRIIAKTEYEEFNENPDNPSGLSYTTTYNLTTDDSGPQTILIKETLYPFGKRKDVEKLKSGLVTESYTEDIKTGRKVNLQSYTYTGTNLLTHTDARGGITSYSYNADDLLTQQTDPETSAGQQRITRYSYDDARRMEYEEHQDSESNWIRATYNYNETTGFLDSVVVDDDYGEFPFGHNGKQITTRYTYNSFGQVIRERSSDGVVAGKTYGLGGELKSDFVISAGCDPNQADPNLVLVSQTWYIYDNDGRIEYIKKADAKTSFQYGNPQDPNDTLLWVTTQYQYDYLGRKTAVIEDVDGSALKTEYEYNNQSEVKKVTLPGGKWTETYRDGRGRVIAQIVGHNSLSSGKWQMTEFEYDADGNLIKQTDPAGVSTIYEYDDYGRLKKVKRGGAG